MNAELMRTLGITRVARITGLDRTGVEVACAIRPRGHILQVSNGKGFTFERAAASAVSEAAELWAAEQVDPRRLVFDSWEGMTRRFGPEPVWGPDRLGELAAPGLWSSTLRCAWRDATDLFTQERIYVLAQAVHCPPPGQLSLGPSVMRWTSNAMGAHPSRSKAVLHALLEALERDALSRALPGGWTREEVGRRRVDAASVSGRSSKLSIAVRGLHQRGFGVGLFDLSASRNASVAAALLIDHPGAPIRLTAGYACRLNRADAFSSAVLEAAQSRLTDIHGAREDRQTSDHEESDALAAWCMEAPARRLRPAPDRDRPTLERLMSHLWRRGHRRIAVVDLAPRDLELAVVKVFIPGLTVSGLM